MECGSGSNKTWKLGKVFIFSTKRGLGKSWKVEAGTGRVKVGMSELEMLFRPAGKSWNWNWMLLRPLGISWNWNLLPFRAGEMAKES